VLNSFSPAAGVFLDALVATAVAAAGAAVAIYVFWWAVRWAKERRAWWLWPAGLLLLVSLGPTRAHSVFEYVAGWALSFVVLAVAVGVVVLFFRDNVLAYLAAAFASRIAQPLVWMLSQPAKFLVWNGILVAALALIVLGWMFLAGGRSGEGEPAVIKGALST
jgi:hypothetical protein